MSVDSTIPNAKDRKKSYAKANLQSHSKVKAHSSRRSVEYVDLGTLSAGDVALTGRVTSGGCFARSSRVSATDRP
jgi:hypothetical protein